MRALGVDYGGRRIGLALSDPTGLLARPWKTVPRVGNPQQVAWAIARELAALAQQDEQVGILVLGHPRRLDGRPNDQTATVLALAEHLRAFVTVPVVLQDERLTSREADERLAGHEKDWRKRKDQLDAMAAAVILQDYLDGQPRASNRDPGTEDDEA